MRLRAFENLGLVSFRSKKVAKAREDLAKAEHLARQLGRSYEGDLCGVLCHLVRLEMAERRYEAAEKYNEQRLAILKRHRGGWGDETWSSGDLPEAYATRGRIQMQRRLFRPAKNALLRAHGLAQCPEVRKELLADLNKVKRILAGVEALQAATSSEEKYRWAKSIADETSEEAALWYYEEAGRLAAGDPDKLCDIYVAMAVTKQEVGDFEAALRYYEKEYDIVVCDRPAKAAETLINMHACDLERSGGGGGGGGLARLEQALRLAEKGENLAVKSKVLDQLVKTAKEACPEKVEEFKAARADLGHVVESEAEEESAVDHLSLSDLDLEITDDEGDEECGSRPVAKSKRRQKVATTRNEKGIYIRTHSIISNAGRTCACVRACVRTAALR